MKYIKTNNQPLAFGEFVALMALMTALVALSIDALLPALPEIGADLGVQRANDNQLIITLFFLGMTAGQMIYGPVSDSAGRKPTIYAGLALFMVGCFLCFIATSFPMMLLGRVLQGVGVAGPRIVSIAVIRDQYEGREMAQVMSFIMTVFILVPILAPAIGQAVLTVAQWRTIFAFYLGLAVVTAIWLALRQPETLPEERRIPFSLKRIGRAIREVVTTRVAFGYTLAAGLVSGGFLGYLNSSQQIFQDQYGLGRLFPLVFGVLAVSLGLASFANTRLVMRYGMHSLVLGALVVICGLSALFFVLAYSLAGNPPLWLLMIYFLMTFFCIGILFGNINALAMEPLGHIAGVGAAVVGALSLFIAMIIGGVIGQSYNGTVLPLVGGFALFSLASVFTMRWAEAKRLRVEPVA